MFSKEKQTLKLGTKQVDMCNVWLPHFQPFELVDLVDLARGSRGFTKYWDGGSEMSRITGNKRNMGANNNHGFPM